MENYKESMVLYESSYLAINYLPDEKLKLEAIEGLLRYGFYGEIPESSNPFVNMIYVQAIPSMKNAKQRYEEATENGKKGGKPPQVPIENIISMKNSGMTNKQIAEQIGCSVSNIENRITTYNKSHPNNPNNLSVSVSVSDSVSVSSSYSTADAEENEEEEKKEEDHLKNLLLSMDCKQLSEIKELHEKHVSYIEIAKRYNIPYFNAAEFVEIYDTIYKEQYDMEHPEEKAAREQREREHREFERREREEEEAFLKHLRGIQQNKRNQSTPTEQKRVTEQAIMIDGSLIDSRLRGHLFPEDTVNKIQSGEIDKNDLVSLFVEYDSTNDEEAQNCGSLKFLNQG